MKKQDLIGGRDQHLLRPVDDEVPPGVERTLVQLGQVSVRHPGQQAVGRAHHDRNLADERLLVLRLDRVLPVLHHRLGDVHIEGRGVGEVPQPHLIKNRVKKLKLVFRLASDSSDWDKSEVFTSLGIMGLGPGRRPSPSVSACSGRSART